jgi:cardiolipin synthase
MRMLNSLTRSLRGPPDATEADDGRSYFPHPGALKGGHRLQLLRGGEQAFEAMLAAIRGARQRILLETYILRADAVGERFSEALRERARAGVRCLLMYDSLGSLGISPRFLQRLREGGVEVVEFSPIAPWRHRWGISRRNHQKVLVVDEEEAFVGGLNVGAEHLAPPEGECWFDLHTRLEGPVVADLARLFRRTWTAAGGRAFREPVRDARPGADAGNALVQAIDNHSIAKRGRMPYSYRHAIRRAQRSVNLMNAYFIPIRSLRRALRQATERGVEVRVVVPGASDVAVVQFASRYLYGRLLRDGVRIFEYPDRMMHAKVAVIDGVWSTIGSYNLDVRSMFHNLEAGLLVLDEDFAGALTREFEATIAASEEVRLADWRRRPWWNHLLEWVSYRFRYWL